MNKAEDIANARFVVFCLEAYRRAEGITGAGAADRFAQYAVTDYLRDGYDLLHTLGETALVDDIREFIQRRARTTTNSHQSTRISSPSA